METFITDAQLLARLLGALQKAELDTSGVWDQLVTDANQFAYTDIVQALTSRGFSAAQIASWDDGPQNNLILGVWWALTTAGSTKNYDQKFIDKFDIRPALKTQPLLIGGLWMKGATGPAQNPDLIASKFTVGQLSSKHDRFRLDMKL